MNGNCNVSLGDNEGFAKLQSQLNSKAEENEELQGRLDAMLQMNDVSTGNTQVQSLQAEVGDLQQLLRDKVEALGLIQGRMNAMQELYGIEAMPTLEAKVQSAHCVTSSMSLSGSSLPRSPCN